MQVRRSGLHVTVAMWLAHLGLLVELLLLLAYLSMAQADSLE